MSEAGGTRAPVIALILGVGVLVVLLALGVQASGLVLLGAMVVAPGLWWRWRTREFRRGVRALRRGNGGEAAVHFRAFLEDVRRDDSFLRYQPFFNLGRPYDYVAAAHNNLGALSLQEGDSAKARRHFDAALERPGRFPPACYGRAAVNLLESKLEQAELDARAGLDADPKHRPSRILLALILAERGDRGAAEEVLAGLRKPLDWDNARSLWSKMYRFWNEEQRAARWG